ncbi:hypothetical protein KXD93_00265 [Mucilaginibacter sp. BJC16-A38]|uniref:hypothetical protein n=1 Tax=Mucilaginibacter phenanthrenivorans TaxID=1234842 RepID=UPI0021587BD2|nr:hypothetical protein [Mucilaginibacter phenanthrenivorans]MCR8556050.1 hypothetical protein [Mucilaginibacter phenanthrenivorans]
MKYLFPLAICLFIVNSGCDSGRKQKSRDWNSLTVISEDHTVITINNFDDTSLVKFYDNGGFFTGRHKLKIDSSKAYFTMKEKDSLFNLASDIISNPVQPRASCTDFVGDLKLIIDYGKLPGIFRQSVEYSGVCNWDTLSLQTSHLHQILKRKIKALQK